MAMTLTLTIPPDTVLSFDINPGTLLEFLEPRAGPLDTFHRPDSPGCSECTRILPPHSKHFHHIP